MEKTPKSGSHTVRPKGEEPREALSLRIAPELKRRLETEAVNRAHSVSAEVEYRLQRSLEMQALLPEVLGLKYGDALAAKLIKFGEAAKLAETTARMMTEWNLPERFVSPMMEMTRNALRDFHLSEAEELK